MMARDSKLPGALPRTSLPAAVNLGSVSRKSSVSTAACLASRSRRTGCKGRWAGASCASHCSRAAGGKSKASSRRPDRVGHCSGVIRMITPRAHINYGKLRAKMLREAPEVGKRLSRPRSVWPFLPADSVIPTGDGTEPERSLEFADHRIAYARENHLSGLACVVQFGSHRGKTGDLSSASLVRRAC